MSNNYNNQKYIKRETLDYFMSSKNYKTANLATLIGIVLYVYLPHANGPFELSPDAVYPQRWSTESGHELLENTLDKVRFFLFVVLFYFLPLNVLKGPSENFNNRI